MAWLNTDWGKELEQVELKVNEVLDEKVEPLAERLLSRASTEASTLISKSSFELHEEITYFFAELKNERGEMMKDLKAVIRYGAGAIFLVILASAVVITLLGLL
jgi:hypothetical protein